MSGWLENIQKIIDLSSEKQKEDSILMKKLILSLFVLCFVCSCTIWQPICRHDAVYAAIVVGEKYPVRFVCGEYKTQKHVRAQALINGKWLFIEPVGKGGIRIGKIDPWFRPTKFYTFREYIERIEKNIIKIDTRY